jgi:hypothetical protein
MFSRKAKKPQDDEDELNDSFYDVHVDVDEHAAVARVPAAATTRASTTVQQNSVPQVSRTPPPQASTVQRAQQPPQQPVPQTTQPPNRRPSPLVATQPSRNAAATFGLPPDDLEEIEKEYGLGKFKQIIDMGFKPSHAWLALRTAKGNVDDAISYCLELDEDTMDRLVESFEIGRMQTARPSATTPSPASASDKPAKKGMFKTIFGFGGGKSEKKSTSVDSSSPTIAEIPPQQNPSYEAPAQNPNYVDRKTDIREDETFEVDLARALSESQLQQEEENSRKKRIPEMEQKFRKPETPKERREDNRLPQSPSTSAKQQQPPSLPSPQRRVTNTVPEIIPPRNAPVGVPVVRYGTQQQLSQPQPQQTVETPVYSIPAVPDSRPTYLASNSMDLEDLVNELSLQVDDHPDLQYQSLIADLQGTVEGGPKKSHENLSDKYDFESVLNPVEPKTVSFDELEDILFEPTATDNEVLEDQTIKSANEFTQLDDMNNNNNHGTEPLEYSDKTEHQNNEQIFQQSDLAREVDREMDASSSTRVFSNEGEEAREEEPVQQQSEAPPRPPPPPRPAPPTTFQKLSALEKEEEEEEAKMEAREHEEEESLEENETEEREEREFRKSRDVEYHISSVDMIYVEPGQPITKEDSSHDLVIEDDLDRMEKASASDDESVDTRSNYDDDTIGENAHQPFSPKPTALNALNLNDSDDFAESESAPFTGSHSMYGAGETTGTTEDFPPSLDYPETACGETVAGDLEAGNTVVTEILPEAFIPPMDSFSPVPLPHSSSVHSHHVEEIAPSAPSAPSLHVPPPMNPAVMESAAISSFSSSSAAVPVMVDPSLPQANVIASSVPMISSSINSTPRESPSTQMFSYNNTVPSSIPMSTSRDDLSVTSPSVPPAISSPPAVFAAPTFTLPFKRRTYLPYRVDQKEGKWHGIISLKQTKLKKGEPGPQGNRPDVLRLDPCPTREVCVDLCESMVPPIWANKDECKECNLCSTRFSMFNKGHHCRNCGFIVCLTCSDKIWPSTMLPQTYHNEEKMVRVCHSCHYLNEMFIESLRDGDEMLVKAIYASGNANIYNPLTVYANWAYPVRKLIFVVLFFFIIHFFFTVIVGSLCD